MAEEAYDGHPYQAGLDERLVGDKPSFSLAGAVEAVVIARRYVDEKGNRSRSGVEYDLREIGGSGEIIKGARALQRVAGYANGEEVLFHPATKNLNGGDLSRGTRAVDSDGDHVLVIFVNGVRDRAVIVGALTHARANYGAMKSVGERRFLRHQGTDVVVGDDGSVTVTHLAKNMLVQLRVKDGDVVVSLPGGQAVHLDVPSSAPGTYPNVPGVRLGLSGGGGYEPVLRGASFRTIFNALVDSVQALKEAFFSHIHTLTALPTSPPATVPSPPSVSGPGAIPIPVLPDPSHSPDSDMSDVTATA